MTQPYLTLLQFFLVQQTTFDSFDEVLKQPWLQFKYCYKFRTTFNTLYNILEFFKVSVQFHPRFHSFSTSKTELDIQYRNFLYELRHELTNDLRHRKEENTWKNLKLHGDSAFFQSLLQKQLSGNNAKKYGKTAAIRLFWSSLTF